MFAFIFSAGCFAQTAPQRSPLDPAYWGVVYDVPATKNVSVKKDVIYMRSGERDLAIDIYMPPGAKVSDKLPAVVFLNAIGDIPGSEVKEWGIYSSFPRLVAAHGLVGISMNADGERIQETLKGIFDFIERDGAKYGIDATRLGVYAASANTTRSIPFLMSDAAPKGIRAAALYYGATPTAETRIRRDLPVLFILAEGDAAGNFGRQAAGLWQRVAQEKAPWTLIFAAGLPHAFDAFTDNDDARRVIRQSIDFWKTHLDPVPQPEWKPSDARALVEATYWNNPQLIEERVTKYLAANPSDAQAYVYLGRALQNRQKPAEAAAAFEKALKLEPGNFRALAGIGQARLAERRYEDAFSYLSKAIDAGFKSPQTYSQLALAQTNLGRFDEAAASYEKARVTGLSNGVAFYNTACVYSLAKRPDKAFEFLNKAIDAGFTDRGTFENDTDLAPIRSDARFAGVLARLPKSAN